MKILCAFIMQNSVHSMSHKQLKRYVYIHKLQMLLVITLQLGGTHVNLFQGTPQTTQFDHYHATQWPLSLPIFNFSPSLNFWLMSFFPHDATYPCCSKQPHLG